MRHTYVPYTDNPFTKTETEEHFTAALNAASDVVSEIRFPDKSRTLKFSRHAQISKA